MAARKTLNNALTGMAGTYFVAAELSRRGYVALLTLRNTRGIDILVSKEDPTKSVGIQAKASNSGQDWLLDEKAETDPPEKLFYVFVRLNGLGAPAFYIVPGGVVAKYVRDGNQAWLATPGRGGRPHKANRMRNFRDRENQYRDRWESLGLD